MSAIVDEILIFGQQEGENCPLRVNGDEFYARYETLEGYTVVYDTKRACYCYAVLDEGSLVSCGVPIPKRAPAGTRRHDRPRDGASRHAARARARALAPMMVDQPAAR